MSTAYCTEAELETFLSEEGVTAFGDDNYDGMRESGAVSQSITWSSTRIDLYCRAYAPATLADNDWVNQTCIHLAARRLCMRRGNSPPGSIEMLAKEAMEELKAIQKGELKIPDAAFRHSQTPGVTNVRVDPRYGVRKTRVQRTLSTEQNQEHKQNIDYGSEYPEVW